MKKSKLLDIIRVIPNEDRRLFLEYVRSPYFNKRVEVINLCQYLIGVARENFTEHKLEITYCWKKVFPNQKFDGKKIAYLMSNLCQLGEAFLGQRHFENKDFFQPLTTLEALTTNGLNKSYQQKLRKIKRSIEESPLKDADYYWTTYKLAEIEDLHFGLQNLRQYNHFLTTQNNRLDEFFTIRKLQFFCNMYYQKKVLGVEQDMTWPSPPNKEDTLSNQSQLHHAYHTLYQLLMNEEASEAHFLAFKDLLPGLKPILSNLEYIDMFSFAINYCSLEINKGKRAYAKHLLSLYEDGLAQGSLLVKNELSPWIYKNIVKLGLGLKRFEWTEEFILKYSNKLPTEQRKDAFHFNLADLNYYQKNYDTALEFLNQVEFTDLYYKLGAKAMLLKIYFEKDESEAFFALDSSFKILLMRDQQIPQGLKTNYLNFVRFTTKLFKVKYEPQSKVFEKLKPRILNTPNINGRSWVLQQMNEIEIGLNKKSGA